MAREKICSFCGSKIAYGEYCCPSCGAVEYGSGPNSQSHRQERLKKNKNINAAAGIATLIVVAGAAAAAIPYIAKLDLNGGEEQHTYSSDSASGIAGIDTDKIVEEGMQSWEDEYGSLFRDGISVPDLSDFSGLVEAQMFPDYEADDCSFDPETGKLSNRFFSMRADTGFWTLDSDTIDCPMIFKGGGAEFSVTCRHLRSGSEGAAISGQEAAELMYQHWSQDGGRIVDDVSECSAGSFKGWEVTAYREEENSTVDKSIFISYGDVLLQFGISGGGDDVSDASYQIDSLLGSLELTPAAESFLDHYTDEYLMYKGSGLYESDNVSVTVGESWKYDEWISGKDGLYFTMEGVELGITARYLSESDKNLRVSAEEAAEQYYNDLRQVTDTVEKSTETIGGYSGSSVTLQYSDGVNNHRLKYYFISEEDSLVIITVDGTYEKLDASLDDVNSVLSGVKIFSEEEKPKGTMQGVNLDSYSVPTRYDDYYVMCDYAKMWVDPERWTLTKKAVDTGDYSFTYDKGDGALFVTYAYSDLIGKYTAYQLAEYYSKNLGSKSQYTLEMLTEGELGDHKSGYLFMKYADDDGSYDLYINIAKQGDFAAMVYWMEPEGGIADMDKSVAEMLDTFEIFEGTQ